MSKHAPGKWSYYVHGKGSGKRFKIETADKRHALAAIVPNENASTLLTMEQHEANAKLMSAAPELLEAVQIWTRFFAEMPKGQFGKIVCDIGLMNQGFIKSAEAIQKAIG